VESSEDVGEPEEVVAQSRFMRLRGWARGRRDQLEAARTTSPTVGFAFDAFSYDTDTGAPVLAAALGFRVFLLQVPYACVFVIVAAYLADATGRDPTSFFHGRGITKLTANSVSTAAGLSGWARFGALVLALYALFLAARAFLKVVNIVHALVWDVPRIRLARTSRAATVLIGLITVLLALSVAIGALRQRDAVGGVFALVLYTLGPFLLWWYASWRLPHRAVPRIALAPGAALFAIGTEILQIVTVIWFPHYIASKSAVYGTIGTAVVLLLWAYFLGRIITLAAVLNAALWARVGPDAERPMRLPRPSWHLPIFDSIFTRTWSFLFTSEPETTSEDGDGNVDTA
jgi:membrane protein